ncbi:MAG: prephenate dehydratase [Candidatus Merdivicinus sp.]
MLKAVYSGIPGSYAEEAALNFFGKEAELLTASSFGDACAKLASGEADRAVLPIENSTTGAIAAVYDLLGRYGFAIVGEPYVRVRHCLMGLPGTALSEIREVVSHEQGISQSGEFLAQYPHWRCRPVYNTAAAAEMVSKSGEKQLAAIASRRAAEYYGLQILVADINQKSENYTRFVVAAREPLPLGGTSRKFSIQFTLPHTVGSLCHLLEVFEQNRMNLVKIESRPMADRNWEYQFFLDFVAEKPAEDWEQLFAAVRAHTGSFRFLGCYPPGNPLGE